MTTTYLRLLEKHCENMCAKRCQVHVLLSLETLNFSHIGNETTSPLGSDTSRFIILQVRFPSLQLYSRSKRTVLFNRYLTRITDFTHPKKCHTIVAFTIAQRLIDLSTRRSIVTKSVQLYYYRTISHTHILAMFLLSH